MYVENSLLTQLKQLALRNNISGNYKLISEFNKKHMFSVDLVTGEIILVDDYKLGIKIIEEYLQLAIEDTTLEEF